MKRLFTLLLTLSLVLGSTLSIQASTTQSYEELAAESALICEGIGLVVGSGDGLTESYLGSTPSRVVGAKLIVALRGRLDEALNYDFEENYDDYMDLLWIEGRNILGFLKANPDIGYRGKPGNIFASYDNMSVKEYYKLMLVSLGYVENVDFSWNGSDTMLDVMSLASDAGLNQLAETDDFTMEKLCVATVEALRAHTKGTSTSLAEFLVNEGSLNQDLALQYGLTAAFNEDYPAEEDESTEETDGEVAEDVEPEADEATGNNPTISLSVNRGTELQVRMGYSSLVVTASGGTFVEAIGGNNAYTSSIIDGISSIGLTSYASLITHEQVQRNSDTEILIRLPINDNYVIAGNDTVTATVPAACFSENVLVDISSSVEIADSGAGTSLDPYDIRQTLEMNYVEDHLNSHYVLYTDIDYFGDTLEPMGVFGGSINGLNHTISNFNIDSDSYYIGYFSSITNGTITNLNFENVTVNGKNSANGAGVLAGSAMNATITDVDANNITVQNASTIGGIIGDMLKETSLTGSDIDTVRVTDATYAGGVVGQTKLATDTQTLSQCNITGFTNVNTDYTGGILGANSTNLTLSNHDTSVDMTGKGGLFSGVILYTTYNGGILGAHLDGTITLIDSESTGFMYNGINGGIVGLVKSGGYIMYNKGLIHTYIYDNDSESIFKPHRVVGLMDDGVSVSLDNEGYFEANVKDAFANTKDYDWEDDARGLDGMNTDPITFNVDGGIDIYVP